MASLHIEHPITDLATWMAAFASFAPFRRRAGVTGERVRQERDDPRSIVVDLDFPDAEAATAFLRFLRSEVWSTPEASPALDGEPVAVVLVDVDVEAAAGLLATE